MPPAPRRLRQLCSVHVRCAAVEPAGALERPASAPLERHAHAAAAHPAAPPHRHDRAALRRESASAASSFLVSAPPLLHAGSSPVGDTPGAGGTFLAEGTPGAEDTPGAAGTSAPLACFVSFRQPGAAPFFATPPSAPGFDASWGELASPPIRPSRDFARVSCGAEAAAGTFLLALWVARADAEAARREWMCVGEVPVDLGTLERVDASLAHTSVSRPNTVFLGVHRDGCGGGRHGTSSGGGACSSAIDYLRVPPLQGTPRRRATERDAVPRRAEEPRKRPSYTLEEALRLVTRQGKLAHMHVAGTHLRAECAAALRGDAERERREAQVRSEARDARRALHEQRQAQSQRRAALTARRAALRARRVHLARARTRLAEMADAAASEDVRRAVYTWRARILRDLDTIFPIKLVDARELLYSIVDLPLPNGVASMGTTGARSGASLDEAASALGLVAQVVVWLSTYLHTSIHYPIAFLGSRTVVQDAISMMHGPRARFALTGRGAEPHRYEYAVFLLNKDIEQLMHAHRIPVLDLRNTLPNLKNVLVTLSADAPDASYTPA
ncbi:hypothetical protein MSPP1_000118 [Malassezia sp. CBS 17886]|nr:hypothetical protein MSPP1_000118 [Malassezia sp. CBS 17886]